MQENTITANALFKEVLKKHSHNDLPIQQKIKAFYDLLSQLYFFKTENEKLQFTTLFARIAFAVHKFKIPKQTAFYVHHFRRKAQQLNKVKEEDFENVYLLGLRALTDSIAYIFEQPIPDDLRLELPKDGFYKSSPVEVVDFKQSCKVVLLEDDKAKDRFIAIEKDNPDKNIFVRYNIPERNDQFKTTVSSIRKIFDFPVSVNLIDVEIDKEGIYRPKAFVVQPDFLMDVTSVANCFSDTTVQVWGYALKKMLPFSSSPALMIGNIANFFLDELMTNPDTSFKSLIPKVFNLDPIGFALLDNSTVKDIVNKSQKHYVNLKSVILQTFPQQKIEIKDTFLEPTFYSEKYGMQGRLDVYHKDPNSNQSAIVELKSGKVFRPNRHGINNAHYTQTLCYDLLITSTFGKKLNPENYILYSGIDTDHLKYAPDSKSQQFEALLVRNQLITIERMMASLDHNSIKKNLFDRLNPALHKNLSGFALKDFELFHKIYSNLNEIDKAYFVLFVGFIAREHQLAKNGIPELETSRGQASLWLNSFDDKHQNFEILSHLEIQKNNASEDEPILRFLKSMRTNDLANFRVGDISVLYPYNEDGKNVLSNQIFKCSIIAIDKESVTIKLRSKQFNNDIFKKNIYWNLEHDLLDSGFNHLYRGIFSFMQVDEEKKQLLLTQRPPKKSTGTKIIPPREMTPEQGKVFSKIVNTEEYCLLWGPPGTGKTKVMLKNVVQYLINNTDENILLLAYTNRAVDEICDAIESIDDFVPDDYIRIGSRYSTAQRFKKNLLDHKIKDITTRDGIRKIIGEHRIFVSTIASISGKQHLFKLKTFHRMIIDEASQILEPLLVGLLPKVDKFIMIGDHKQLPAVVVQNEEHSAVVHKELKDLGLNNMRHSLFERMYLRCVEEGWDWAYEKLSFQGRMHQDIMAFPNEHFYNSNLNILPENLAAHKVQSEALIYRIPDNASDAEKMICEKRVLFIPTPTDDSNVKLKTNIHEAETVAKFIESFYNIFNANEIDILPETIGVITPYRAQIAQIKETLENKNINTDHLTIDTVERYQGGARDVIILSLCVNHVRQLDSLISLSREGVDRKLNVAITRARKHLVILGNREILEENETYRTFIERYV